MTTVSVVTPSGQGGADVELPGEIFGAKVNIPLMHQVVVAQEAAARQGTHATKTRGEVRGGGKKPYRQKGTGRARQGSLRAPQYAGGGTVFGPVPRSYEQRTPMLTPDQTRHRQPFGGVVLEPPASRLPPVATRSRRRSRHDQDR